MCFVQEADWTAEVSHSSEGIADKKTRCDECHEDIGAGEFVFSISQQEHEECDTCYDGMCECGEGNCCKCPEPKFGETFEYRRCRNCHLFLEAVSAAEIESGCKRWESRPLLLQMIDDIGCQNSNDRDAAQKYFDKARQMHPAIEANGFLDRLWKMMFPRDDD